jgi:hypothetical protein
MQIISPWLYIVCYQLPSNANSFAVLLGGLSDGPLIEEMKKSQAWCHLIDNVWIVQRNETLPELQGKLISLLPANSLLMIMPAKGPVGGLLPKDAWPWLEKMPREW